MHGRCDKRSEQILLYKYQILAPLSVRKRLLFHSPNEGAPKEEQQLWPMTTTK